MTNELNLWTALRVEYANQRPYSDDLFCVYPTILESVREIDGDEPGNLTVGSI